MNNISIALPKNVLNKLTKISGIIYNINQQIIRINIKPIINDSLSLLFNCFILLIILLKDIIIIRIYIYILKYNNNLLLLYFTDY